MPGRILHPAAGQTLRIPPGPRAFESSYSRCTPGSVLAAPSQFSHLGFSASRVVSSFSISQVYKLEIPSASSIS